MVTYQKREYLSISTLLSFSRCPRRYFYQKNGLQTHEESPALSYGTAMHLAIPHAAAGDFDAAWDAFCSVWDEIKAKNTRNLDRARRSLTHYVHTHQGEKSIFRFQPPPSGNIEVDKTTNDYEVPFAIDVGLPIPLVGRLDGLVKHRDTGEDWGYEFKTTSRLTASFFDQFEMNVQVLTYGLVLRTLGKPTKGVMVEGMLTSASKVDNMIHLVPIQDHHLDDIVTWIQLKGKMLLACEEAGEFPKDFAGCTAYSHHYIPTYRCEYSDLCRMPNWEDGTSMFAQKPEHKFFVALTTKGNK